MALEFINDLSTETIFDAIKSYCQQELGTEIQIGSTEFAIASMVSYVGGILIQKFNSQAKQRYIETATGEYLDALGMTFDIPRPEEFDYTDEGDAAYRAYILEKRHGMSVGGPAGAYETRAKEIEGVLDAYCLRYDDTGWVAGTAKVFILTDKDNTADQNTAIQNAVAAHLKSPDWKPVCDTVSVAVVSRTSVSCNFTAGLSQTNAIAGQEKVAQDAQNYHDMLVNKLGQSFSFAELSRLCQTPDENGVHSEYLRFTTASQYGTYYYYSASPWQCLDFTIGVSYETI